MKQAGGPTVDEYWKSIQHGVMVKRVHTMRGIVITATWQAMEQPEETTRDQS